MLGRRGVVFGSAMARWTVATAMRLVPARLRVFGRREDGAAAVEFGIVLFPFVAILLMTMETALVFFAQQNLETVAADSSRLIMTGQAKNFSEADFKKAVCDRVVALFDCADTTKMFVDVQTAETFSAISTAVQTDSSGNPQTTFNPGATGKISVVRLIYKWPILSPLTQPYLADAKSGTSRLLVATSAFRNEPF